MDENVIHMKGNVYTETQASNGIMNSQRRNLNMNPFQN